MENEGNSAFLPDNYMFEIPFVLYKFIGENMHRTSKVVLLFRVFNCVILTVLFFFAFMSFQDKEHIIESLESIFSVVHPFFKYVLFIKNKPLIEQVLLDQTKIVWNSKTFNKEFFVIDTKLHRYVRITQIALPLSTFVMCFMYMLRPLFHDNVYIMATWDLPSLPINTIVQAMEYYLFLLMNVIMVGYDCLYLSFCCHLLVQLKRLNFSLEHLIIARKCNEEKELQHLIAYHNLLLMTFQRLQKMYSSTLFWHYFITLISCCLELYQIMGNNSEHDLEQLAVMVALVAQFAFYTFPAESVSAEFLNVSHSLYKTEWYEGSVKFQKLVLFAMLNAQMDVCFYGAGVIPINVNAFGSVLRKSFSFYTVLRNMLNN